MSAADICREATIPGFAYGEAGDVVLTSQVRLARNFKAVPFPGRASYQQLKWVADTAQNLKGDLEGALEEPFETIHLDQITPLEQQVLLEKHLVSPLLVNNPQHRLALVSSDRETSVMVNEDDHLRIECLSPGLNLTEPLERASRLDDVIEARADLAFDETMGYLTACPTNLGTGLRASVLLHLPGLVYTRNISNIMNVSPQLGLAIRSLYGDDREVVGSIFQISNQLTLGFTEKEILGNLRSAVNEIAAHERRARKAIEMYRKDRLADEVWRSYGILRYARAISQKEALELISKVRLGLDLGLIDEVSKEVFAGLLIGSRTSFLQNAVGSDNLSSADVDRLRAKTLRQVLLSHKISSEGGPDA